MVSAMAALYELDAARKAKRDEVLVQMAHLRGERVDVRSVLGIKNASNALVFRFLCNVAEEVIKTDATSVMAKAIKVACRAVKSTDLTIFNAEKALEVRGIGPHLANMLDRSLFKLYPQQVPGGDAERSLVERNKREANEKKRKTKKKKDGDGTSTATATTSKRKTTKKEYRPKNGTANYAFLVCMHKAMLEGQDFVLKQDLIRMAESSGLSAKSIHGKANQSNAQNRNANWYNGWSCFLTMKKRDPPLVETWSCPMKCKLTREGEVLAQDLHWNAHERQMCSCNLLEGFGEGNGENADPSVNANVDANAKEKRGRDTSSMCPYSSIDCPSKNGAAAQRKRRKDFSVLDNDGKHDHEEEEEEDVVLGTQCSQLAMSQKPNFFPEETVQEQQQEQENQQSRGRARSQIESCEDDDDDDDPYERHLATSSDLKLPPLMENERFADVYDVILCLDNREQLKRNADQYGRQGSRAENLEMYTRALTECGLKVEIGHLAVGDVTWIARRKTSRSSSVAGQKKSLDEESYVLDYVIERKNVDDLIDSIKSNRYGIQKLLLHKSRLSNVLYLVEGDIDAHNNAQLARSALVKMQVKDGFTVVRTGGINGTLQLYKNLTRLIEKQYSGMTGPTSPSCACLTISGLEDIANRERKLTVSDMFKLQLQHIPGIGKQAAEAIVKLFATPMAFWKGVVLGEDGRLDIKNAVNTLQVISLSQGLRKSTLGHNKAKRIMGFLLNSEV